MDHHQPRHWSRQGRVVLRLKKAMTAPLRVLDLFSGTGSVSKAFRASGHEVYSLDLDPKFGPSICVNVLEWEFKLLPRGFYDVIWASCPCDD